MRIFIMDLWSVRFDIQDNFKNIFSEYVEDFTGYVSSSLFIIYKKDREISLDKFSYPFELQTENNTSPIS